MSKTVVQEMIDFVTSNEYNHLYQNVKQEWFNTFLEKEKQQIINAFDSGDFMCGVKERVDYNEADHKYKDANEYYQQLSNSQNIKDKSEILKKYGWDGRIPHEDTITMHSADLLDAMQEYADQFTLNQLK